MWVLALTSATNYGVNLQKSLHNVTLFNNHSPGLLVSSVFWTAKVSLICISSYTHTYIRIVTQEFFSDLMQLVLFV